MPSLSTLARFALLGAAHTTTALQIRQLYQFPSPTFIENIAVRPNGHLLLNTFSNGSMYTLDPAAKSPTAELVVQVPGTTGLTGIAEIAPDVFAVSGGIMNMTEYAYEPGTVRIATVDFTKPDCRGQPTVKTVAWAGDKAMLNGMTALPDHPHIVLSASSREGAIYRTNTATGAVDVAFQDEMLAIGSGPGDVPIGVNGVHIRNGHLYFANSHQRFFGRIPIDAYGSRAGDIEILARVASNDASAAYDDFTLAGDATAYVGQHPHSLVKITPSGEQTVLVDAGGDVVLDGPTSAALSKDEKTVYVVTGGTSEANGGRGQVVAIAL